ncbi:acid protease [Dacryopinax primogenitus]|uniref:Acid protease n=1 Tax=Dacryopinax primogenitus (strain DJM 731) TaxID=1858805 RepID=M5GD20_DACPD|nr:acid protease [Dacryopinax primogenitus]EJU04182.1 acid protease [Dacryopinax primogenitus]
MRSLSGLLLTQVALYPLFSLSLPTPNPLPGLLTIPLQRQVQQGLLFLSFEQTSPSPAAGPDGTYNAAVANQQVQVVTAVQTGNGQTFPGMLVDTGSAFLWMNAGQTKYAPGPHSHSTNYTFAVGYGAGSATGVVYQDQVTIGSATVSEQYIGAATNVTAFHELVNFDGILGLGRDIGNNGSIQGLQVTPTFVDSLYNEGRISERTVGIYLAPFGENGTQTNAGELTFGGVDKSKFEGELVWAPQMQNDRHWAVQIDGVAYGSQGLQNGTSQAIVDTGTLPILLPFDAFFGLHNLINASIMDTGPLAGWLSVPPEIDLQPLTFTIGGSDFPLPPEAYLIPESLYEHFNVTGPERPTWFASGGFGNAALGQKFLEMFYSVYDSDEDRIGFAPLVGSGSM